MFNELKIIENIDILFKTKVILYGAGYHGKKTSALLKKAGIPLTCFCDGDSGKWGQSIDGKEIISPQMLKELDVTSELTIMITVLHDSLVLQIINAIENLNLRTANLLTPLGLDILLAQNIDSYRISESYRVFISHIAKLNNVFASYFEKQVIVSEIIAHEDDIDADVLVYQPGKVGSRTVFDSLLAIGAKAMHTHNLADLEFYDSETAVINEYLSMYRDAVKSHENIKLITLVREPIERDFSTIFQGIFMYKINAIMRQGESFVDACSKWLKKGALHGNKFTFARHQFDWFDCELKTVFGIDIFAHPFDREKGYSIIKQGNVEVLVMKLEKLNSLETVIGEFVGAPNFKLANANEGRKKSYKYIYDNVRQVIKIPKEVVSAYYDNNPRMDHFYTSEEKAAFLKKWENNIEQ